MYVLTKSHCEIRPASHWDADVFLKMVAKNKDVLHHLRCKEMPRNHSETCREVIARSPTSPQVASTQPVLPRTELSALKPK